MKDASYPMERDVNYFACRAAEEREAVMRSSDRRARQAHLQLANRYDDLASSIEARERFADHLLDRVVGI